MVARAAGLEAASWIVGLGGGGGCTDGAIATALAVTVATPAMRTERAEIFITALSSFGIPDLDENLRGFAGCVR